MPSLELKTNAVISDPKAFALEFSKESARILGKPEAYITVSVTPAPIITFAGTTDPAFTLLVTSLDNLSPEKNEKYSKELAAFLGKSLSLPHDRGYITFLDPGRAYLGYQSTTFATIFGK
ncbi:related to Macrophage migration inhibitory factor [Armillaria ostoyae]|uniref:L-dopachrome isomerase n=1 Tax=Armillaria ostoyae TaxID=47428 RepID=A0A284R7K7_ARMOS|nr:related to Macrophage migration inhibitory factor [Armillaria ostoyae]